MEKSLFQVHPIKSSHAYVICYRRKNVPRISVMVCEHNCRFKSDCQEYKMFYNLKSESKGTFMANQAQVG